MSKINISFDGANYSVDEFSLASATAELKNHLSINMYGSGATINLGGASYNINSTKLSNATNDFISHLTTIAGTGSKVVVNGVEHAVDSAKMGDAITEIHSLLASLESKVPQIRTFTLEGFDPGASSTDNGDNTFNFVEGMTWGAWKNSEYNSVEYAGVHHFATIHNNYTHIDVALTINTPIEGICYADGTPVEDDELIMATTYYYEDLDEYTGNTTIHFTIDGKSYTAKEGMTFGEWVRSSYDNEEWHIVDTGDRTAIVNDTDDGINLHPDDGYATADTIIEDGRAYWTDSNW